MNRARGPGILATILLGSGMVLASQDAARAAGKIHLVIVADTLDPKIGPSVRTSAEQVESAFRLGVPEATGVLHVERIEGERCRREVILSQIAALAIGPDDALLVFYSGHGAYDPRIDQYLKFPRLNADGYLAHSDLIRAIRSRRPRLGVVATDCCNKMSVIPRKAAPQAPAMAAPFPERPRVKLLFQALFLDAAGFVDLTSSKRGEESIGYPASRWEEGGPLYFARGAVLDRVHRGPPPVSGPGARLGGRLAEDRGGGPSGVPDAQAQRPG